MILTKTYPGGKTINTVFDEFFGTLPNNWNKSVVNGNNPAVNILESNDAYHLELNVPGRNKEEFKINIEKGLITISFDKKEQGEKNDLKTIRKEFEFGSFKRSFSVDDKINTDGIQAKYENGILKLFLPKKEEVKVVPQQIEIQ